MTLFQRGSIYVNGIKLSPIIAIAGAAIAIASCFMPWVGSIPGISLFVDYPEFYSYIPFIIIGLSVATAVASFLYLIREELWFMPLIMLFLGVAIMILTSVFSMWTLDGSKVTAIAGMGFWLSYAGGALMIIAGAFHRFKIAFGPAQ